MADDLPPPRVPPLFLVILAAWVLPGAGYWLIGQRSRGTAIGVSILSLFVLGLLVGGVRVIEVPGYNTDTGQRQMVDVPAARTHYGQIVMRPRMWALQAAPVNELRNKPWSLPQAMVGPVAIVAGFASVWAAQPDPDRGGQPRGALTHARINEIGQLYLSVAGLLNLMVIIDAAHRAVHLGERRAAALAARVPAEALA